MRGALACAAALVVAISGASAATRHHHPRHMATPTPDDVKAYLAKCQASETECVIGVSEARASFHVTQILSHEPDYCVPAADDDSHVLANKVTAWLKDHPDHGSDPVYTGINAALEAMYPCKQ